MATTVITSMELNDLPGTAEVKTGKILRCPQEGCGKEFRSSPGYRYHLKSHALDPRPHVCQCCHKKFKSANGLKYHLRKAHNIEPVLSKQNLATTSPKGRDSISSEEEHYISLGDSYPRNFLNNNFPNRNSSASSPLLKSPLGGLGSPLMKNLPGIPSPLLKSPMDIPSFLNNSSNNNIQSPYGKVDRYSQYFEKPNNEHRGHHNYNPRKPEYSSSTSCSRSSLSEYTQSCQQANNQLREQCQRLSCGEMPANRLPSAESYSILRSSCEMYNRGKDTLGNECSGNFSSDYHRHSIDSTNGPLSARFNCDDKSREYDSQFTKNYYRDFPNEGKEYPYNLANHNLQCHARNDDLPHYRNRLNTNFCAETTTDDPPSFRVPYSVQNTEQIVPDISVPNTSPNMPSSCDKNNNNSIVNLRGTSESSNETELSDCVFGNENSNPPHSPPLRLDKKTSSVISENKSLLPEISSSCERLPTLSKPLLSRRTSRSKSIPPLTINASATSDCEFKSKDVKISASNKLLHLAEIATSPRSPFRHSPLPLTLTPSILPEATPDWVLKSPFTKFAFPEKPFLSTPTIGRINCSEHNGSNESPITTSNSLPPSPFLDNVQTPSFWPSQVWPTPVWLCFLKGCSVKFEQDDKEYMTTEEVAAFCTTPGGRRRDDMNFYTSGMKIVAINEEKPSLMTARDMVSLTLEQIIPGPQRLVSKCAIDHPFYIKHKGWSAANPTEAMARYGQPFRKLSSGDIVIPAPQSKLNQSNALSPNGPVSCTSGPQIFTFSPQDTSRFSQSRRLDSNSLLHEKVFTCQSSTSSSPFPSSAKSSADTITLTYTNISPPDGKGKQQFLSRQSSINQQKLANEFRSISQAMKKSLDNTKPNFDQASVTHDLEKFEGKVESTKVSLDHVFIKHEEHDVKEQLSVDNVKDEILSSEENKDQILEEIDTLQKEKNNNLPADSTYEYVDTTVEGDRTVKKQRKKRRKPMSGDVDKRRPMNGFMLFAKKMRIKLTQVHPGKDNRAISKLLGDEWRELSEKDREEYSRNAKEMADERMKVNPDCWKRKHRKEKDGVVLCNNPTQSNNPGEILEADRKKVKLESGVMMANGFNESSSTCSDIDSNIDVT